MDLPFNPSQHSNIRFPSGTKVAILIIFSFSFLTQKSSGQIVNNGIVILYEELLKEKVGVELKGKWKITFVQNGAFDNPISSFEEVPKSWDNYQINGVTPETLGTTIYELTILNPQEISELVLFVYGVSVEYIITANDEVLARSKKYVAESQQSVTPSRRREILDLPNAKEIHLKIEVSNEVFSISGLNVPPIIALKNELLPQEKLRSNIEMIQIGCVLLMAVYNLILFFQFQNLAYMYHSIFCWIILVRALIVHDGSLVLYSIFPEMSFELSKKIEYFTAYGLVLLLLHFTRNLLKEDGFKRPTQAITIATTLLMAVVLFTPAVIFGQTLNLIFLLIFITFFIVFAIIYRAIKRNQVGAKLIAFAMSTSLVFTFVEILFLSGVINEYHGWPNIASTGVVVFLFIQTIVITKVFAYYREESIRKTIKLKESEKEKKAVEEELRKREKELADFTFSTIQRNKFIVDVEQTIEQINENKETENVPSAIQKFSKLINLNRQSNHQWEDFNRYFGNVHQNFFNKLGDRYTDLSSNDLRTVH